MFFSLHFLSVSEKNRNKPCSKENPALILKKKSNCGGIYYNDKKVTVRTKTTYIGAA